ncbi:hypothetical protein P26218_31 [Rhodoferax phage P26218]|uniref:hypothetical protein n=1 Tax=Rhodoferax phage P26218 TaxID=1636270 RepID=UPI0005FEB28D|nr:hypothetical protein AXJ08_gp31 [Rhodoferax phage P26218]AKA60334.1 hypothetical protein P26218_31 [Rhodoferax phage P26218]
MSNFMPPRVPLVDPNTGMVTRQWYLYFQGSDPAAATAVVVGVSPFTYVPSEVGSVVVRGGTVSLIEVIRKGIAVNVGVTAGIIPIARGDQLRITYTVLPTVTFLGG